MAVYPPILPGQRFGRLTVLEEAPRRGGRRFWLCLCDCGKTKTAEQSHLRTGHVKSCGCLAREGRQYKNLSGQRFGKLTALEPTEQRRKTSVIWRCRCDCGKETLAESENLLRGNTQSCGCLRQQTSRENMASAIHFQDGTCIERIAAQKESTANTSGHRGVTLRPNSKWRAELTFRGKRYHLGYFDTFEDAVKARLKGEEMYTEYLEDYFDRLGKFSRKPHPVFPAETAEE